MEHRKPHDAVVVGRSETAGARHVAACRTRARSTEVTHGGLDTFPPDRRRDGSRDVGRFARNDVCIVAYHARPYTALLGWVKLYIPASRQRPNQPGTRTDP